MFTRDHVPQKTLVGHIGRYLLKTAHQHIIIPKQILQQKAAEQVPKAGIVFFHGEVGDGDAEVVPQSVIHPEEGVV